MVILKPNLQAIHISAPLVMENGSNTDPQLSLTRPCLYVLALNRN